MSMLINVPGVDDLDPGVWPSQPPTPICFGCLHFPVCKWADLMREGPATVSECSARQPHQDPVKFLDKYFQQGLERAARWLCTSKAERVIENAVETDVPMEEALANEIRMLTRNGGPV